MDVLLGAEHLDDFDAPAHGDVARRRVIVHVIRAGRIPFIESKPSLASVVTTVGICLVGIWLPTSPLASALGLIPMPYAYAIALFAIFAAYMILTQVVKTWLIRRFGLS